MCGTCLHSSIYFRECSGEFVSFSIDLRNAFESVAHSYIDDTLRHIDLPSEFRIYVHNLYSSLSAHVFSKNWKTQSFVVFFKVILCHRSFFSLLSTLSFSH